MIIYNRAKGELKEVNFTYILGSSLLCGYGYATESKRSNLGLA